MSVVIARRDMALTAYHPHGAMPIGSYPFRGEYSVLKVRVPMGHCAVSRADSAASRVFSKESKLNWLRVVWEERR